MNIYIDESGIFSNPANKNNIASCVAALAIPSGQKRFIVKAFKRLLSTWNLGGAEPKGSKLNESHISAVIQLLKQFDVILDLVVMDLGYLSEAEIIAFKIKSADGITSNLTDQHHEKVVARAVELREAFLKMSNPLFVQAGMLNILVPHFVQNIVTYYARRMPEEIGRFYWFVDAKDKHITNYEKTWSTAIYPYIYTQSLKNPLYFAEEGDYSHFERNMDIDRDMPRFARDHPEIEKGEYGTFAVNKVLGGGFKFEDSRSNYGLQLIDILVNAIQRAFNGKLDIRGWGEIGALMIAEDPQVQLITFDIKGTGGTYPVRNHFKDVIVQFGRKAKPMFQKR